MVLEHGNEDSELVAKLAALGIGYWVLGIGYWVLGFGYWILDIWDWVRVRVLENYTMDPIIVPDHDRDCDRDRDQTDPPVPVPCALCL